MKKIAVIDIGSNSVRLMKKDEQIQKFVKMTQLGKGLHQTGKLSLQSINESIDAIKEFCALSKSYKLYCFATEAVRSASNGKEFCDRVKRETGIEIDVLSPKEECLAGFLGAGGKNRKITVLDVGGASTEIITGEKGRIDCAVSIPIGAVRLFDKCGENLEELSRSIIELIPKDLVWCDNWVAIGGTATAIGAMLCCPNGYEKQKIQGQVLSLDDFERAIEKLLPLTPIERSEKYPVLDPKRAKVMVSGASIILAVMQKCNLQKITLSDIDNAEGYLILRNYED